MRPLLGTLIDTSIFLMELNCISLPIAEEVMAFCAECQQAW